MKKKLLTMLLCSALLLGGCGKTYNEAENIPMESFANGYFTVIKEWGSKNSHEFNIVYANDTKVMYIVWQTSYKASITPLYNADGSLQIYGEDYKKVDLVSKED